MRSLLPKLSVLALLSVTRTAFAQSDPKELSCAPFERELQSTRAALSRATQDLEAARARAGEADAARAALERAERELQEASSHASSCQASREELCHAAGSFARALASGRVTGGLSECIAQNDRHQIVEQLSGWSNATSALAQFGAYSAGESDIAPRLGPFSGTKAEKLILRLFTQGSGSPLVYRRLLIEAIQIVAPRSWREIKAKPGAVDKWFASNEPLAESFVAEANAEARAKSAAQAGDAAPLSTALQLVSAYQIVAECNGPTPARECQRAVQIRQVLESNGPLIARRRIQDVWASECSSLTDAVVLQWLGDLPPARTSEAQSEAVAQAIHAKLTTCFLRDSTAGWSFSAWLATKLPNPEALNPRTLERLHALERWWQPGSSTDRCARAVRAMQTLATPSQCSVPKTLRENLQAWTGQTAASEGSFSSGVCERIARSLFAGDAATLPNAFPAPPTVEDAVRQAQSAPATSMHRLRMLCEARAGKGTGFETALAELGMFGRALGENPGNLPWRLDEGLRPIEKLRAKRAESHAAWFKGLTSDGAACSILELGDARCRACRELPEGAHYDCALIDDIERSWAKKTRAFLLRGLLGLGLILLIAWAIRLRRALKVHANWQNRAMSHLRSIGLEPRVDGLRYLFPSRFARVEVMLPRTPAWERWGERAALVRSEGPKLQDRDVNRAGVTAQTFAAQLALLVHDEAVSPELGAVRAMLEWAARGGTRAVHILPIPWSRLEWSRDAADLLELAEESSLRSNPFEVRGRVTSSSQFFDRERLVSGLLASAQAGHFTVVTGLRRFGKSSLALEVARRLPGPSAYVDLAGFHHEIRFSNTPAEAADAILRFLCLQLLESARSRYPAGDFALTVPEGAMDATTLTMWFRDFCRAAANAENGKTVPVLLILDEIEQAIGAATELNRALDVFAILVGRLRNSLPGTSSERGQRVGLMLCSALHPLLWSPLGTLAHQSLIGSFEYVTVPCLPEEAATSMMRALGSRQGIRFTDAAVELLVRESQGVPLLVRRLGSAVLELYDPERARQGALGAVEIGIEGVRAALEREEAEGSPLRVWIESEIAEPRSPGGAVLRHLARLEWCPAGELRQIASRAFRQQFEITGVALALTPEEALRRAQEAAGVVVRMLGNCGLLKPHGDPTEPDGYELPNGVIRRVLSERSSLLDAAPASLSLEADPMITVTGVATLELPPSPGTAE